MLQAPSINNKKRKVISYFSFLRVIACLGVIIVHIFTNSFLTYKDTLSLNQRFVSQIGAVSFMWTVPVFMMVSGALLLDEKKEISIPALMKKYIGRMFIALIIFTGVYQLLDVILLNESLDINIVINGFYKIITGTGASHLWYLYALIGLYLILPLLKQFTLNATDSEYKFVLSIMFVFLSVIPLLEIVNIPFGFYVHFSTIYPFYFLMGYALHSGKIEIKPIVSIGMIIIGLIVLALGVYGRVYMQWDNINVLWDSPTVPVVLEAIGLFSLCTHIKKVHPVIYWIDGVSFGIYLIHMIFIRYILTKGIINPYQGGFLIQICIIATLSFGLSAFITFVLKKLPLFKNVL